MATKRTYDELLEAQRKLDEQGSSGRIAASDKEWELAWKTKEKSKEYPQREDHSDPTPLLADKISSLPATSARRRNAEILKHVFDNSISTSGQGLDSLTRESYKELKRLAKHSSMLHDSIEEPAPSSNELYGVEEGTVVSNLQNWKSPFANAVKPVSDAMGSHADTSHGVNKSPTGSDQALPTFATAHLDNITPHFTNEFDASHKAIQMDNMQHMPSKMMGSIRNLSTVGNQALSVPFELASDVYNGLLKLTDEIANLGDLVMTGITKFVIGPLGGLINGIVPTGLLKGLIGPINKIASQVGGLNQLLGGFEALKSVVGMIGSIASGFLSILGEAAKLLAMFLPGSNPAGILGGFAGASLGCVAGQLQIKQSSSNMSNLVSTAVTLGSLIGNISTNINNFANLGNFAAMIGGSIGSNIGKNTKNIRNMNQLISKLLPKEIGQALNMLSNFCGLGRVNNMGFSIGTIMDFLPNTAFSLSMKTHATHASILSPLNNKQSNPIGPYSRESYLSSFEDSKYVKGAQGNKGVTMHGPGGTASQKVFGKF
jgi:hypothetical protein